VAADPEAARGLLDALAAARSPLPAHARLGVDAEGEDAAVRAEPVDERSGVARVAGVADGAARDVVLPLIPVGDPGAEGAVAVAEGCDPVRERRDGPEAPRSCLAAWVSALSGPGVVVVVFIAGLPC
jgi:hypothetical protein